MGWFGKLGLGFCSVILSRSKVSILHTSIIFMLGQSIQIIDRTLIRSSLMNYGIGSLH
jgi:hypothetical protein